MKEFTRKVLFAVAPVFGVAISVAVLQAAHMQFPPPLLAVAWPQWVVFASVVHTSTALCMFVAGRLFRSPTEAQTVAPKAAA